MDYSTLLQEQRTLPDLEPVVINSLYTAFQGLADPRKRKGKRHELAVLLTSLVLAKLAGETSLSAATQCLPFPMLPPRCASLRHSPSKLFSSCCWDWKTEKPWDFSHPLDAPIMAWYVFDEEMMLILR